ncbi:ABC transporter permease [Bombilactobacillus folatiphilus]|uniref:ABC transporter permease n=1 Tax=Bombilactobacillus folatiphilus TaxID=2923362 RepID=A0ABY4P822_9LACO|nr:ABC transporter permease [Bombilactobacillus folatiphilus]UQS81807.1 ABC transporter permease [Bombilactobacillus folatiphilus]
MLILKNNFSSFWHKKSYVILTLLVLLVMTIASAYFVTMKTPKAEIGVRPSATELLRGNLNSKKMTFKKVVKDDHYYQNLLTGKYDAYITKNNDQYHVTTIRKTDLSRQLTASLNHKKFSGSVKTSKQTFKILFSVLTLSMMMLAIILTKFYFDDRNGLDKRIFLSGTGTGSYIIQNLLFNFLVLLIIGSLSVAIVLPLFNIKLSPALFGGVVLSSLVSASFGLMLATLTANNEGTLGIGTMLIALTTLLSGAFFPVKKGSIQAVIQYWLPQHYLAQFGKYLDGSKDISLGIVMILCYTIAFTVIAVAAQKKRMTN